MTWFSSQWNKWGSPSSQERSESAGPIRRVQVVWGRERMQIVLPKLPVPVTLGHLKAELEAITSIPASQIKLIHSGLLLKDDRASLAGYGIREGSRLVLVGSPGDKVGAPPLSLGEQKARDKKAKEADTSEAGLLARIEESLQESRTELFPKVDRLEQSVEQLGEEGMMTEHEIATTHRNVSELLLRQLLNLDGVQVNSEATRAARKQGVKDVQSHLDRLDEAWNKAKSKGVKPP